MKTISVNTTQNVAIEYELALLRDRIFAFIIDMVIFGVFYSVAGSILIAAATQSGLTVIIYGIGLMFIFYSLAMEYFMNGQSFGKKALKLKIIKISGEEAGLSDYIARWAFRMIDIYFSLGSIACILIGSSQKGQRLGDIVANTAVVYLRPSRDVSIRQIVNSYNSQNYQVTYYEAKSFTDSEMLVLKSVIERCDKYNNDAHEEALLQAAEVIKQRLGLEGRIYDSRAFLKTILNDYIVLTR
jgi:uncharacterized RDD family membrane protein YckC